jgi:hypothetical protein
MLRLKTCLCSGALALLLVAPTAAVWADRLPYLSKPQVMAQKKNNFAEPRLLSKSQAAAIATSRHGGKVLKVESAGTKGNYKVRLLLENGRIKTVAINSPRNKKG